MIKAGRIVTSSACPWILGESSRSCSRSCQLSFVVPLSRLSQSTFIPAAWFYHPGMFGGKFSSFLPHWSSALMTLEPLLQPDVVCPGDPPSPPPPPPPLLSLQPFTVPPLVPCMATPPSNPAAVCGDACRCVLGEGEASRNVARMCVSRVGSLLY